MRARRFRPLFDRLDARLVLSDVAPGLPGSGLTDGQMPGDEIDPVVVIDYYGSGNPPASQDDPVNPTTDVNDYLTPTVSTD